MHGGGTTHASCDRVVQNRAAEPGAARRPRPYGHIVVLETKDSSRQNLLLVTEDGGCLGYQFCWIFHFLSPPVFLRRIRAPALAFRRYTPGIRGVHLCFGLDLAELKNELTQIPQEPLTGARNDDRTAEQGFGFPSACTRRNNEGNAEDRDDRHG